MPESIPHTPPDNQAPNSEISREEIIRLRKERREQAKIEKQNELNEKVAFVLSRLECSLEDIGYMILTEDQRTKLVIKLESYILKHPDEEIDTSTLADAIIEAKYCLDDENCGIKGLLEGHQRRTLMQIAEIRKEKAEQAGNEEFNPYEALFETESGEYYVARLLNMPHLEEESAFMKNCVGTSDSYVNRMKKGDIEILSFRHTPRFNKKTQKLDVDKPILTIEYNLKTKTIEQIKAFNDEYLTGTEVYFQDVLEALRKLKETPTDKGDPREIKDISSSELQNIQVEDYKVFTEKGPIHFEEYDEKEHGFILKKGKMPITKDTPKFFAAQVFNFLKGTELQESEIANNKEDITENTKLYIGELYPNIFKELPQDIEHIYTSFPENKVYVVTITIPEDPKTPEEYEKDLEKNGVKLGDWGKGILRYINLKEGTGKTYRLIIPTVNSLGFTSGATRSEIKSRAKELGIGKNLLPGSIAPGLRFQMKEQKEGEIIVIDMEAIPERIGGSVMFILGCNTDGPFIDAVAGDVLSRWSDFNRWAFYAE